MQGGDATPADYRETVSGFANRHTKAELQLFFDAHSLGDAFRQPHRMSSKLSCVNAALGLARSRGDLAEIIRAMKIQDEDDASCEGSSPSSGPPVWETEDMALATTQPPGDGRSIFLVHGRNTSAKQAVVDLLQALDLRVKDWEDSAAPLGDGAPSTLEIVEAGIRNAAAVVVLMTPDDVAQLSPALLSASDGEGERQLVGQARPNVILEAGMALMLRPKRVLFVKIGKVRDISDIAGLNYVSLYDEFEPRDQIRKRLVSMGLHVDPRSGWNRAGNFEAVISNLPAPPPTARDQDHISYAQSGRFQQGFWRLTREAWSKYSLFNVGGDAFNVSVSGDETLIGPRNIIGGPDVRINESITFTAAVSAQTKNDVITVEWTDAAGKRSTWQRPLPPG